MTSRAALHWVPRAGLPGVLATAHRLLRPGGLLRIECGGAGNVPAVVAALDRLARPSGTRAPWNFTDAGPRPELVEQAGFRPGRRRLHPHRRPAPALHPGRVRRLAPQPGHRGLPPRHGPSHRGRLHPRRVDADLDAFRRHDGTFDQTYVRLDLLVRR